MLEEATVAAQAAGAGAGAGAVAVEDGKTKPPDEKNTCRRKADT